MKFTLKGSVLENDFWPHPPFYIGRLGQDMGRGAAVRCLTLLMWFITDTCTAKALLYVTVYCKIMFTVYGKNNRVVFYRKLMLYCVLLNWCCTVYWKRMLYSELKKDVVQCTEKGCGTVYWKRMWYSVLKKDMVQCTEKGCGTVY